MHSSRRNSAMKTMAGVTSQRLVLLIILHSSAVSAQSNPSISSTQQSKITLVSNEEHSTQDYEGMAVTQEIVSELDYTTDAMIENSDWNISDRFRIIDTIQQSYNWSERFNNRDPSHTFTIVLSAFYSSYWFGGISLQQSGSPIRNAIEDYLKRENNGLQDYYFELVTFLICIINICYSIILWSRFLAINYTFWRS